MRRVMIVQPPPSTPFTRAMARVEGVCILFAWTCLGLLALIGAVVVVFALLGVGS